MADKGNVILLTGTINPDAFKSKEDKSINVALNDKNERLAQYENTISRYIKESPFTDVVFTENDGYYRKHKCTVR